MPISTLDAPGKKLYEQVYNASKKNGDSEEVAAKKAWAAIKTAGWKKEEDGIWRKQSEISEFSMVLKDVAYNKETDEMRWKADASDIDTDSYDDNMSMELFSDFIFRIGIKELPPEEFRSEFWSGGNPYLSISHYPDLNGDGVPGDVKQIYVDGTFLKAKGTFFNTSLGKACFHALYEEMNWTPKDKSEAKKPVRVSIGFLDWGHKHKSDGSIFERKSLDDSCPRCVEEIVMSLTQNDYQRCGKIYLKGQLIHLALTRVPVNKRTIMEVDKSEAKSMVTQLEDAASIVGDEKAEELEEKAKLIGKSEVLVTRADTTCPKCGKDLVDGKCPECDNEDEMNEEAKCKKKKSEAVETKADYSEVLSAISELKSMLTVEKSKEHPLDATFAQFKSDFDGIVALETSSDEKLKSIQGSYARVGETIISLISPKKIETEKSNAVATDLVTALKEVMSPIAQKLELVSVQLADLKRQEPVMKSVVIPQRTSINPSLVRQSEATPKTQSVTPNLRAMLEKAADSAAGIMR